MYCFQPSLQYALAIPDINRDFETLVTIKLTMAKSREQPPFLSLESSSIVPVYSKAPASAKFLEGSFPKGKPTRQVHRDNQYVATSNVSHTCRVNSRKHHAPYFYVLSLSHFAFHFPESKSRKQNVTESTKMQSRLLESTARTSIRILSAAYRRDLQRRFCAASSGQTADPAIHSGEREAGPAVHKGEPQGIKSTANAKCSETEHVPKEDEFLETPKSPYESSAKLKSHGVNQRLDPTFQQKRKQGSKAFEDVSCAGLDGSPWPEDQRNRAEKLEDEREYYKQHKASPLSELEFADSRKPITRATDGTADSGAGRDVTGWLPEQLDTAEEALRRATEIWRQNAMRGDPDAPHSRVLRALRGEDF
ncbi:uncharacterized protein LOC129306339 [Prosopis cineraria]|uniref:uncharacterized protein LOC129306339 n=1 Tax=Prosopis cineraria TaxID=364024 RepID=UPI00240F83C8|nr:uncharacterized protein LOC129306339 [Prosopis cineraria]XP_054802853.1 uncharacterized protein LOC129306339 [Prosopis cineraria]XP_054802854.1 uncharacterized protein LOC129306339 [Prosopis cineraria]XP_054802855.1 uncharacterized protein LOC129306339 [Prosopis cineraria]XP_054802856.1 uncharacterized protein LOC129306339 [Prosopis cineraria]XP_054802857.1 uncharacterized protein LOC129306339 [Prosopis cineraria]